MTFIHYCINYVSKREQEDRNMIHYQYVINFLSALSKDETLMTHPDIRGMLCSRQAIASWLCLIDRQDDFAFISSRVRCISYDILIQMLKLDVDAVRSTISEYWSENQSYKIYFFERFIKLIDYFSDYIINQNDKSVQNCDSEDYLSSVPELMKA